MAMETRHFTAQLRNDSGASILAVNCGSVNLGSQLRNRHFLPHTQIIRQEESENSTVMGWLRPLHGFATCTCWLLWMVAVDGCCGWLHIVVAWRDLLTPRLAGLALGTRMYLVGSCCPSSLSPTFNSI